MQCLKCDNQLVESNSTFYYPSKFYTRLFCFGCETLFEINSFDGKFLEDDLNELGEIDYLSDRY